MVFELNSLIIRVLLFVILLHFIVHCVRTDKRNDKDDDLWFTAFAVRSGQCDLS